MVGYTSGKPVNVRSLNVAGPHISWHCGVRPQTRCCRFAAVGTAGRRYRSIVARQRSAAAAGECGQCHVVSVRKSKERFIVVLTKAPV